LSNWEKSFVRLNPLKGWLFDVYPSGPDEVAVWIIAENGERLRLVDRFTHKIYVSGVFSNLNSLAEKIKKSRFAACGLRFVEKYADFMEDRKQKVLEIEVNDFRQASVLARKILVLGEYERFRLCNVDVPISQAYLYDKDVFPLARQLSLVKEVKKTKSSNS
jgi:hypothetical protein